MKSERRSSAATSWSWTTATPATPPATRCSHTTAACPSQTRSSAPGRWTSPPMWTSPPWPPTARRPACEGAARGAAALHAHADRAGAALLAAPGRLGSFLALLLAKDAPDPPFLSEATRARPTAADAFPGYLL